MPTMEHTCGPRYPCSLPSLAIDRLPLELHPWNYATVRGGGPRRQRRPRQARRRSPSAEVVRVDLLDELAELVDDLLLLLGLPRHRVGGVVQDLGAGEDGCVDADGEGDGVRRPARHPTDLAAGPELDLGEEGAL